MFIGHYSAALVLKKVEKKSSLGWLFLGVQLVDIVLFLFVLLGLERINIVENFTASTHLELEFIPYTHSLLSSFVWAIIAYFFVRALPIKENQHKDKIALVIALGVFSHWFFDLIVHTPDLPLAGDNSPKLGLGLWNNAILSFTVEAILLLMGLWVYLRATKGETFLGKYGMVIFAIILIAMNTYNIFGPPPENSEFFAVFSLTIYFALAGGAFWLDRKRA
jgi:hypothetical protein